jgi:hypothetical protein
VIGIDIVAPTRDVLVCDTLDIMLIIAFIVNQLRIISRITVIDTQEVSSNPEINNPIAYSGPSSV